MKKRSVCSLPAWLLVVLSVSSTATTDSLNASLDQNLTQSTTPTCSLNITNFKETQQQFEDFRTVHRARIINIRISGIEWSSSKHDLEVFDPNWWIWTTNDFSPLLKMPVDYTILSFGLSRLAIKDLKVDFVSSPAGCERGLKFEQEIQIAMESILQLMGKAQNNDGLICRSVYSRKSVITHNVVGVGKICCTREQIFSSHKRGECCHHTLGPNIEHNVFSQYSPYIILIGFLLPIIVLPLAMELLQYHPMSANEQFTEYLLNKRTKLAYFRLSGKGRNGEKRKMDKWTLLVEKDELIPYEGNANLRDLFKQGVRGVISGKIKLTLLFILQFLIVVCWLGYYSFKRETLRRFDSAEKIVFNLRNNPYSWIFTDSSLWPSVVGYILVMLNFSIIIQGTVWWLLEIEVFRVRFAKCLCISNKPEDKWRNFKKVKHLFDACFANAVVCSYVFVYSLFNSIIYVIGGLIVSVDIVASWATGVLLVVYYFHRSFIQLVDSYTEIKRLVFQVCQDKHAYRAMLMGTREMIELDYREKSITDTTGPFQFDIKTFEGPIWFVRDLAKDCYRSRVVDGIASPTISRAKTNSLPGVNDASGVVLNEYKVLSEDLDTVEEIGDSEPSQETDTDRKLPGEGLSAKDDEVKDMNEEGLRTTDVLDENGVPSDTVVEIGDGEPSRETGNDSMRQGGLSVNGVEVKATIEEGWRTTGVLDAMISKDMLRGVCRRIRPICPSIRKAVVKLIFIVLFLSLVMFTAAVFRPNTSTGDVSVILTSLATLLAAMVPKLTEMMSTNATRRLKADNLKFKIEEILAVSRPKFKVIEAGVETNRLVDCAEYMENGLKREHSNSVKATMVKGSRSTHIFGDRFDGGFDTQSCV